MILYITLCKSIQTKRLIHKSNTYMNNCTIKKRKSIQLMQLDGGPVPWWYNIMQFLSSLIFNIITVGICNQIEATLALLFDDW